MTVLCGLAGSPQIVRCVVLPPVDSVLDALCPDRPKGKPAAAEGKRDKKKVRVAEAEDASGDEVRFVLDQFWGRGRYGGRFGALFRGWGTFEGNVLVLYSGAGARFRGAILGVGCGFVRVIVRNE